MIKLLRLFNHKRTSHRLFLFSSEIFLPFASDSNLIFQIEIEDDLLIYFSCINLCRCCFFIASSYAICYLTVFCLLECCFMFFCVFFFIPGSVFVKYCQKVLCFSLHFVYLLNSTFFLQENICSVYQFFLYKTVRC